MRKRVVCDYVICVCESFCMWSKSNCLKQYTIKNRAMLFSTINISYDYDLSLSKTNSRETI